MQKACQLLKADSLLASQTIKSCRSILPLLQARKEILSGSGDILAAKHLIGLHKEEADFNDLQEELET